MDSNSKHSEKLPKGKTKIPSVSQLNEDLGISKAPLKIRSAFQKSTLEWRRTYKTSNGRNATELLEWQDSASQQDLRMLAEGFLRFKQNGERFWSPSRDWKFDSTLQFPETRERIVELLMQLFWKQNRYLQNNVRAIRKDQSEHPGTESLAPSTERDEDSLMEQDYDNPQHNPPKKDVNDSLIGERRTLSPTQSRDRNALSLEASEHLDSGKSSKRRRRRKDEFDSPTQKRLKWKMRDIKWKPVRDYGSDELMEEDDGDTEGEDEDDKYTGGNDEAATVMDHLNAGTELEHQPKTIEGATMAGDSTFESQWTQMSHEAALDKPHSSIYSVSPPPGPMVWRWSEAEPRPPSKKKKPKRKIASSASGQLSQETQPSPSLTLSPGTALDQRGRPTLSDNLSATPTGDVFSALPIEDKNIPLEDGESLRFQPPAGMIGNAEASPEKTLEKPHNHRKLRLRFIRRAGDTEPSLSSGRKEELLPTESPEKLGPTASILAPSATDYISSEESVRQSSTDSKSEAQDDSTPAALALPVSRCQEQSEPETNPDKAVISHDGSQPAPRPSTDDSTEGTLRKEPATSSRSMTPVLPKSEPFVMKSAAPVLRTEPSPGPAAAPKPRPKAQMSLFIITRKPFYTEELWSTGKFQGVSLSEFVEQLETYTQKGDIDKVKLTLRTSVSAFVATVLRNDDNSWETAKRMFNNGVKAAKSTINAKDLSALGRIDVHVEPFYVEMENSIEAQDEEEDLF